MQPMPPFLQASCHLPSSTAYPSRRIHPGSSSVNLTLEGISIEPASPVLSFRPKPTLTTEPRHLRFAYLGTSGRQHDTHSVPISRIPLHSEICMYFFSSDLPTDTYYSCFIQTRRCTINYRYSHCRLPGPERRYFAYHRRRCSGVVPLM